MLPPDSKQRIALLDCIDFSMLIMNAVFERQSMLIEHGLTLHRLESFLVRDFQSPVLAPRVIDLLLLLNLEAAATTALEALRLLWQLSRAPPTAVSLCQILRSLSSATLAKVRSGPEVLGFD